MNITIEKIFVSIIPVEDKIRQEGSILSHSQQILIKKYMSEAAQELCNLDFDPLNMHNFTQQQASLKGQLQAFQFLLDTSEAAEIELRELALRNQQSQ